MTVSYWFGSGGIFSSDVGWIVKAKLFLIQKRKSGQSVHANMHNKMLLDCRSGSPLFYADFLCGFIDQLQLW